MVIRSASHIEKGSHGAVYFASVATSRLVQSFPKQTTNSSENTVLLWVIWMVFAGNLEDRWEGGRVGVDAMSYSVRDLILSASHLAPHPVIKRTCWLIKMIPISFLCSVNRSKADSIAALSVLLSTIRKFFCGSAPLVTCCE